MILTIALLQSCIPAAKERAPIFLECLNHAMLERQIDSPKRVACFLATVAHESGSLRYTRELWGPTPAQLGYEGRKDLGNTHVGDGFKYLGRGAIQITGRANTTAALLALGRKEDDIEYLETPIGSVRSAAWFWQAHRLNEQADLFAFGVITKIVNGGFNGIDDRIRHLVRCCTALGVVI